MVQKADRARIKALLTEAITVLCKNGLGYKYSCAVEGLLGITLDDEEVFLVNINENIAGATKRPSPEPEVAKAGTDSPAGGSPSTTPRRRRRRSNSGNMDRASPAKRANYGGGDEQQAGRQQEGSDVIVIKEEVSQEEFSDFYGDTGDGQDDSTNQYAMQQHQAQADQYGAGCSQWDTSQTQSGQSDWPAFTPTQQQQHAISQAASSAMLSPSQSSSCDAATPTTCMKNVFVRRILSEGLVQLALRKEHEVTAVRLTWPKDLQINTNVWASISTIRDCLDELLRTFPDWVLFVSAVTGSLGPNRLIRPAVNYWLVTRSGKNACRAILQHMQTNQSGAIPKLLIQPYQTIEKDFANVLYTVVKDNVGGCVPRMVAASEKGRGGVASSSGPAEWEPVARIHLNDHTLQAEVQCTVDKLTTARFPVHLVLP